MTAVFLVYFLQFPAGENVQIAGDRFCHWQREFLAQKVENKLQNGVRGWGWGGVRTRLRSQRKSLKRRLNGEHIWLRNCFVVRAQKSKPLAFNYQLRWSRPPLLVMNENSGTVESSLSNLTLKNFDFKFHKNF